MKIIEPNIGESLISLAIRCNALYICPKDARGNRLGPLVAYAGKGKDGRNLIGDIYFNFRKIEQWHLVLEYFARVIYKNLIASGLLHEFDTICGIPEGGRTLGQSLGSLYQKRFVYATKVPKPTEPGKKQEYRWDLSQFEFVAGERLLVMEDVINNLQNTNNMLEQIACTGAKVVLLGAALNRSPFADKSYTPRSGPFADQELPIVCALREPFPEYEQSDPEVVADVVNGNIEFEVKKNWPKLIAAMEAHPIPGT